MYKLSTAIMGVFVLLLIMQRPVYAIDMAGEYTLPYPAAMPGNFNYKISQAFEKFNSYWSFGNLSQFEFHLHTADKYLVQSKTLFEYRQYLLAYNALQQSNAHYNQLNGFLQIAKSEGKITKDYEKTLSLAAKKHIEVLKALKNETPDKFTWTPEKTDASYLQIHQELESAINLRKQDL